MSLRSATSPSILVAIASPKWQKCRPHRVDLVFAASRRTIFSSKAISSVRNDSRVDAVDDDWDKFPSSAAGRLHRRAWITACRRLHTQPNPPTLWVIGSYHNIFRVGTILHRTSDFGS